MEVDVGVTIIRRLEFDSGHRLQNHEGKCKNMHGHRYRAHVEISSDFLDGCGRVIDFGKVKEIVGGWIDEHWDHSFIVERSDEWAIAALSGLGSSHFVMDVAPTVENMSEHLFTVAHALLMEHDVRVTGVVLWETPNCCAVYRVAE